MSATQLKAFGSRILPALRSLAPWVAVGCVALALLPRADELKSCLDRLGIGWLTLSFLLCTLYRFLNAGIWAWIVESLGHRISYLKAMRAWLTSESLRWLPGSVWGFCSRVDAARTLGIPGVVASLSLPVELALTIVSWGIVALAGVLGSGLGARLWATYGKWFGPLGFAAMAALVGLALVSPLLVRQCWFRTASQRLLRVLKLKLNPGLLIRSGLSYTALNVLNGLGFWLILAGMGYQRAVSPTLAVGVNAVGWLIGFFAIGVPGGIGVREAGASLLLTPVLPWPEAALVAIIWRMVQIGAELATLLPWLFLGYARTTAAKADTLKKDLSSKETLGAKTSLS
jgi:glycosyltransferase 2 family protein